MSDWCDSVPFIKEPTDRAQLTRAGIAKTTSDAKINTGDNSDAAGVSPLGFTSFVRPAQIPKILNSADILWTKIPRSGATTTDTGVGIEDWSGEVQFPAPPVYDATDIDTTVELIIKSLSGTICDPLVQSSTSLPAGSTTESALILIQNSLEVITNKMTEIAAELCNSQASQVALGDVILTVTSPSYWGSNWEEPLGQQLLITAYPQLYALFLNTYGPAAPGYFRIPDLVQEQNYLKAQQTSGGLLTAINGGQTTRTLGDTDMPDHTHTVNGSTTSTGEHSHTFPVYRADGGFTFVDGNGGTDDNNFYTTPSGGSHSHTISGNTDPYGETNPDPVWNTATSVTPRYTNFFLKMRVK